MDGPEGLLYPVGMHPLFLVALGGALGASLRWQAGEWLKRFDFSLPLGTLCVNLFGALAIGWFMGGQALGRYGEEARLVAVAGFLGGLTTFSAFSFESFRLFQQGNYGVFAANVLANNIGCLALAFAGWKLAQ